MPSITSKKTARTSAKTTGTSRPTKKAPKGRPVLHEKPAARLYVGDNAMTATQARELLGWHEIKTKGLHTMLKDRDGKRITCSNNLHNRPLYMSNVYALLQEILMGRWRFNGEPIIIGTTGQVLNGQHSMIALVLAHQEWTKHGSKWMNWQSEPTIDKMVVFGVSEDDDVVNTLDTCRKRTLTDVLYRSEFFQGKPAKIRKKLAAISEHAVRLVWDRTGGGEGAYSLVRTHSESIDFLHRHPKLLDCGAFVHMETADDESVLRKCLSPGYMTGMMYLMASSGTDPTEYVAAEMPTEDLLDMGRFDKACDYLEAVGKNKLPAVVSAIASLTDGGTREERLAIIAKGWTAWVSRGKVAAKDVVLQYGGEFSQLLECPVVGGVDRGRPDPAGTSATQGDQGNGADQGAGGD